MEAKIITPSCKFDCEMIVGLDVTLENQEIRKIYDESIAIIIDKHYTWVSISDFKNANGQTIGEFLLDNNEEFAVALSKSKEII